MRPRRRHSSCSVANHRVPPPQSLKVGSRSFSVCGLNVRSHLGNLSECTFLGLSWTSSGRGAPERRIEIWAIQKPLEKKLQGWWHWKSQTSGNSEDQSVITVTLVCHWLWVPRRHQRVEWAAHTQTPGGGLWTRLESCLPFQCCH